MHEDAFEVLWNGLHIRGSIVRPEHSATSKPVVVMAPGFASSANSASFLTLVKRLSEAEIPTLRFSFAGQPGSDGDIAELTPLRAIDQLASVIRKVQEEPWLDLSRIGLIGSSFGGNTVLNYTATYSGIRTLALKSPASDYRSVREGQLALAQLQKWEHDGYIEIAGIRSSWQFYLDTAQVCAYDCAHRILAPCLIVHGDKDEVVPITQSSRLIGVLGGHCSLDVIANGDHNYTNPEAFRQMIEAMMRWIRMTL